jgi:hypothetical protein
MPNQTGARNLTAEIVKLEGRTGGMPSLGEIVVRPGTVSLTVVSGIATFAWGVQIGTSINKKYLHFGQLRVNPDSGIWSYGDSFYLIPHDAGAGIAPNAEMNSWTCYPTAFGNDCGGLEGDYVDPYRFAKAGWTVSHYGGSWQMSWPAGSATYQCPSGTTVPPLTFSGASLISLRINRCQENWPVIPASWRFADGTAQYIDAEDAFAGPMTDAPGGESRQGYVPIGPIPGDFMDRVVAELAINWSEYPTLGRWLHSQLLSDSSFEDPTGQTMQMPDCSGQTVADCNAALDAAGLPAAEVVTLPDTDLSSGDSDVVVSDPEPGDRVEPDEEIKVGVNPPHPTTKKDSRCEPTGHGAPTDPGGAPPNGLPYPQLQPAPTPWDGPYSATVPGTTSPMSVPLRYGTHRNTGGGWGWRHISTNHGYGSGDKSDTQIALATDTNPELRFAATGQYLYRHSYPMPDGEGGTLTCFRTVAVQTLPDRNQILIGDVTMRGIVNSFVGVPLP